MRETLQRPSDKIGPHTEGTGNCLTWTGRGLDIGPSRQGSPGTLLGKPLGRKKHVRKKRGPATARAKPWEQRGLESRSRGVLVFKQNS